MANLKDTTVNGELRVTRGVKMLGPLLRFFKSPTYGTGEPIEYVKVVDTDVNIGANTNIQYNLGDYVSDVSKFDIRGARIEVTALDTETGSPTNGDYVNSEAMITKAISGGNAVKLHNYSNATAQCKVYIALPIKARANA
ncbi:MAG: hypothetical protein CL582_15195 [Alteromonadaceae bacterium]|nr:hypothetical protein [Alteromonadaceae bacterium]|tara:strand:+ start:78 stop:497 length:420 start_codon:yes stop_codon:yes gene_type:complete